ncbi:MAG: hypothetical protein WKF58_18675 [Ilumatobacteraceae bacterium]
MESVYRIEHPRLWRALVSFTGDTDVASDAESEAFTQALRRGEAIEDVRNWVWRSAFLIAKGMLAERRPDGGAPDHVAETTGSLAEFLALLQDLSDQQRACVVLRYVGGFRPGEIAVTARHDCEHGAGAAQPCAHLTPHEPQGGRRWMTSSTRRLRGTVLGASNSWSRPTREVAAHRAGETDVVEFDRAPIAERSTPIPPLLAAAAVLLVAAAGVVVVSRTGGDDPEVVPPESPSANSGAGPPSAATAPRRLRRVRSPTAPTSRAPLYPRTAPGCGTFTVRDSPLSSTTTFPGSFTTTTYPGVAPDKPGVPPRPLRPGTAICDPSTASPPHRQRG